MLGELLASLLLEASVIGHEAFECDDRAGRVEHRSMGIAKDRCGLSSCA